MVVGGLNEIRGENILEGGSGGGSSESKGGSGGSSSGSSNQKGPIKPSEKVNSEPSGKLSFSLKSFSSEYNDDYLVK